LGASLKRLGHRPLNSQINVTPFVDVMLVLLVIFMVTAPLMYQGMDVNLPETTTQALRLRDDPLILSVKKDGTFFLGRSEDLSVAEQGCGAIVVEGRNSEYVHAGTLFGSGEYYMKLGNTFNLL